MQTFLPYSSYRRSAECLDWRRLGNQRSECLVLLRGGWPNHPASKMWQGHMYSLAVYAATVCEVWAARGYKDTCLDQVLDIGEGLVDTGPPWWVGWGPFHASHRSNLLRKDHEFYSQYGWTEGPNLPYVWPTQETDMRNGRENL